MARGHDHDEVFLPYGKPVVDDDDIAAVVEVLQSGWLTTGPAVAAFENALAEATDVRFAVACASGTAALHLAAMALGLGPGDVVVVPGLTFLATANAMRMTGAEVAFSDVDPDTGLMRPGDLEAALERAGKPVRAVVPVHLNGQTAYPPEIADIAASRGAAVIEDAAHTIGSLYDDGGSMAPVGSNRHALLTTFSFHPVKTVAMGEGGAVTTNDAEIAERLRRLRNHGMEREPTRFRNPDLAFDGAGAPNPWYYEVHEPGLNYRASDIHCALGTSQLAKRARFIARRRELVARYDRLLEAWSPAIRPLARVPGCRPAWHLYVALIDFGGLGIERSDVVLGLRSVGIGSMVHYLPVHMQPYYRDRYGALDLPGAQDYYRRALSLPLFPAMADEDVDRVVESLTRVLGLT